MKLDSVPHGFRDIYEGVGDEDFENPVILTRSGDSTQSVVKAKTKTLELIVNGDGAVGGNSAFAVQVDGHIGDGEVDIVNEFDYDTISADATAVSFTKVRREKIPTV